MKYILVIIPGSDKSSAGFGIRFIGPQVRFIRCAVRKLLGYVILPHLKAGHGSYWTEYLKYYPSYYLKLSPSTFKSSFTKITKKQHHLAQSN